MDADLAPDAQLRCRSGAGGVESAVAGEIAPTILAILTTDLPPLFLNKVELVVARTSKKEEAKQELAARLGVPVEDILKVDQVASMMKPPTTKNTMSKNPKGYPPFFIKGHGHSALYPRAWVEEHLATGKVKGDGGYVEGAQPWPLAPPPPSPIDQDRRDNALALLDALGVDDPDYRKAVSEGS